VTLSDIQLLYHYNYWANRRILAARADITVFLNEHS
jgi:uncharacterized damage-inducible protein DinB